MKGIQKRWLIGGALATVLLAGCAHEGYAYREDRYHHRRWSDREHRYEGRPPHYEEGHGVDVYVTPEPNTRGRW
jgi:hypothetical protein